MADFQDERENAGGTGGGAAEGMANAIEPLKKYIPIIIAGIVIIAALYWYFAIRPQPGTITVIVSELDSDRMIPGATISISLAGNVIKEGTTDDDGSAVFGGVPTGEQLSVSVDSPISGLDSGPSTIALASAENGEVDVKLERKTELKIDSGNVNLKLGPACAKKVDVAITNAGTADEEAELVASDGLESIAKIEGGKITLFGGDVGTLSATISAPEEGKIEGMLRIRGTQKGISVSVERSAKSPKTDVSFERSEAKDFRVSTTDLPVTKTSQVRIRNNGDYDAPPLSDINVQTEGEVSEWITIDKQPIDEINGNGGIQPSSEGILFTFSITVPAGTAKGTYSGRLKVSSSCGNLPTSLYVNVE